MKVFQSSVLVPEGEYILKLGFNFANIQMKV